MPGFIKTIYGKRLLLLIVACWAITFPANLRAEGNGKFPEEAKKEKKAKNYLSPKIKKAIDEYRFIFDAYWFFDNGKRYPVDRGNNYLIVNNNSLVLQLRNDQFPLERGIASIVQTRPIESITQGEDEEGTLTIDIVASSGGECKFTIPAHSDECRVVIKTHGMSSAFYFTGRIRPL